ncbi:Hypp3517 [Branchiostoma lanceolatum]|uniref:Hypp3517 protein n=1 Tax=Branchiostoma lanceolatum TaxID=7740 RepID=A0A8K0A258_BRALA|nr:Hypp3517 [Branchiostoma lanceolatum]
MPLRRKLSSHHSKTEAFFGVLGLPGPVDRDMVQQLSILCITRPSSLLHSAVQRVSAEQQFTMLNILRAEGQPLVCSGDGRADTPGHCAKYGTYTLMELRKTAVIDVQLVHWDDALSKTVLLRQLTGDALQTYGTAPDPIKEGPCNLILDFMQKLFSRLNDPSHYEAELFALGRRPNELPQALAVRIRRLIAKVHPQADQLTRDSLGLREFVGKITDKQMAWEVQRSKPETFHDAVIALQYYEDLKAQYQTQSQTSHPVNYSAPRPPAHVRQVSDPSPAPALHIQTVLASQRRELRELQQAHEQHVASLQDRFETVFEHSRQPIDPLLRPSSHPWSPKTYNPAPRRNTKYDECNYCHETGHWKNDCPQLLRAASRETTVGWLDGSTASHHLPYPPTHANPPSAPPPLPSTLRQPQPLMTRPQQGHLPSGQHTHMGSLPTAIKRDNVIRSHFRGQPFKNSANAVPLGPRSTPTPSQPSKGSPTTRGQHVGETQQVTTASIPTLQLPVRPTKQTALPWKEIEACRNVHNNLRRKEKFESDGRTAETQDRSDRGNRRHKNEGWPGLAESGRFGISNANADLKYDEETDDNNANMWMGGDDNEFQDEDEVQEGEEGYKRSWATVPVNHDFPADDT